jgi:hypothetical protein
MAVAAGLDRLPQPDALLVIGNVLDLVGDRAGVHLAQPRQSVGERVAAHVEAEERSGDPCLELRRELRDQALRLERRVARRLRAERIEMRGEMPDHAEGLDERHPGGDAAEQLLVDRRGCGRLGRRRRRFCGGRRRLDGRRRSGDGGVPVAAVRLEAVEQHREPGLQRDELVGVARLEDGAPLVGDGGGVVEVLLEDEGRVARVQSVDLGSKRHLTLRCSREKRSTRAGGS